MDLSIILVNYKTCHLVVDCIESISMQTSQNSYEVIVVDNHSEDDCDEVLQRKFPGTVFVQMGYNAGFARANNAGMEISKGEYILILNNDTIILDGAIDKTINLLKQFPEAVGAGVQLLNADGSHQISGAHIIKGGLNTLLPLPYLGRLIRYFGYKFKSTIPSVQTVSETVEVDWIVGAYLLVKRSALTKSGLMDNDFFMYAEEIEWCGRLRKQGKLLLFAEPKVIHFGGGTSSNYYGSEEIENGKNLWDKKGGQIIVSTMVRIRKQFGAGWYTFIFGVYLVENPIFLFCLAFDKLVNGKKARYKWKNLSGYARNIAVLVRLFFRILINKPYFYKLG